MAMSRSQIGLRQDKFAVISNLEGFHYNDGQTRDHTQARECSVQGLV